MKDRMKEKEGVFDLDTLLHPASAFAHPMDVVRDADLTLNEKRAILASWASDVCAVEAAQDLRVSTSGNVVRWTTSWMLFAPLTRKRRTTGIRFPIKTSAGEKGRGSAWGAKIPLAKSE